MLLSESVEVLWFVPKLVVAYMQASGCDLKKRWSCYLLSLCHWGPSVFCSKALRSLQQEGYLYFLWSRLWSLSQYMSEFVKSTVTARELPDEQQGGMSVLLPTSVIRIIHCCLATFFLLQIVLHGHFLVCILKVHNHCFLNLLQPVLKLAYPNLSLITAFSIQIQSFP